MGEKWLKIALMITHIFHKENWPYKSRFSSRKLLGTLLYIKKIISVNKVLLHLSPPWVYACFSIQQSLIYTYYIYDKTLMIYYYDWHHTHTKMFCITE